MLIPIRNVWLLQLFASSLYQSEGSRLVAAEENPEDLPQLVARILADEVTHRLHMGLTVGFRHTTRSVTRVRGRINVLTTARHQLLLRGQVNCTFDEIVTDVPANRLVRAALERAWRLVPDEPRYRSLALQLAAAGVRGPCPPLTSVSSMQRQRLLARDRLMIAAAELLLTFAIPTTGAGQKMLPLPFLEDRYMRKSVRTRNVWLLPAPTVANWVDRDPRAEAELADLCRVSRDGGLAARDADRHRLAGAARWGRANTPHRHRHQVHFDHQAGAVRPSDPRQ